MSYREIVEEYSEEFADALTEQEYEKFIEVVKDNRLLLDMYEEDINTPPQEDNWKYEVLY